MPLLSEKGWISHHSPFDRRIRRFKLCILLFMLGMLEGCVSYTGGHSGKTVTDCSSYGKSWIIPLSIQTSVSHYASVGARGGHIEHILSKKVSK